MSFVSAVLRRSRKLSGTAAYRRWLLASNNHRARVEKNIDRIRDAFSAAAQLLERYLPCFFGL
jgi:hypothetical protein